MATGLIGEKAEPQPREPRQLPRSRPDQVQRSRPGQPQRVRPARPGQTRPGERRPVRPLEPKLPAGGQAAGGRASSPAAVRAPGRGPQARSRTPFVLLLVALLGGGLVCLLLINTTLAEGSFQITAMQQQNANLAQQAQALQQQTAALESPASIAARAQQLGMRPVGRLRFIDLKNGRIYSQPATEPGVVTVPGYTP